MCTIRQQVMSNAALHTHAAEAREKLARSTKAISAETGRDSRGAEDISTGTGEK